MKEAIIAYAKELNLEFCGFTKKKDGSIFVSLFPYYTGEIKEIGIARYARLPDYHQICKTYLERIGAYAKTLDKGLSYEISVDREGNPERLWAKEAGLGFIGKNHCLINPVYGSFVFIGALLFSKHLDGRDEGPEISVHCHNCKICVNACPTGTLQQNDFSICLSRLTQQKQLEEREFSILCKTPRIWGCDFCQQACPYNCSAKLSPLSEFYKHQLNSLEFLKGIEQLSNREFQKKYQVYPFTWRGKKTIERNLKIYQNKETPL